MRDQNGGTVHDLGLEWGRLADGDVFLPLGLCQGAGHFIDEDGGSEEFMDLPLVFIAQPAGFRRERAGNDQQIATEASRTYFMRRHRREATPGTGHRP